MRKISNFSIVFVLFVVYTSSLVSNAADMPAQPKIELQAQSFALSQVRLLPGPFLTAQEMDRKYLHLLDSERLLHNFRINAGLPSTAEPLGGWEKPDCEVRGHSVGHFLSGCALMYASTRDEVLKNKVDAMVAELAKCQKALGNNGYLSAFPETFFDRVEAGTQVWAPYYTIHKILNGLIDVYLYCDNSQALEIAEKMGTWVKSRCDKLSREQMQFMLNHTEQGGMNDGLTRLYECTNNETYLTLARRFDEDFYTEPLARREDRLKGEHVNSFIPNIIGTANEYKMTGEETNRAITTFFWDQVTGHRCFATGGTSNYEAWRTDPGVLSTELSPSSQETCCQYNLLKLTRHLYQWDPQVRYVDYYEKTLYNSILSTIDPATGMTMYYVPLDSGHFKVFGEPNDSFWCCTGTGMENHAKYGDSIYFHNGDTLFVNLFIPSELRWKEKDVTLRQETLFPGEEKTTFTIHSPNPVSLDIKIRIPAWIAAPVTATINGETIPVDSQPSSYLSIQREWKEGDRIELTLPMKLSLAPMPDDANLAVILYGPLVLAGELGTDQTVTDMQQASNPDAHFAVPASPAPRLIVENRDPQTWIERLKDRPLAFRTIQCGTPADVTLVPFHTLFGQRYAIYWPLHGQEEWAKLDRLEALNRQTEEARKRFIEDRLIDRVQIGVPESETSHNFKSEQSAAGEYRNKRWRHATGTGWFSYEMKALPDRPMALRCTYWGGDDGRTFDILIDEQFLMRETLALNCPGQFLPRFYIIPMNLTADKEKITVKFQCRDGKTAGGVFDCALLEVK